MYACTPSVKVMGTYVAGIGRAWTRTGVDFAWVDGHAEDGDSFVVQAALEVFHEHELHRLRHRCVQLMSSWSETGCFGRSVMSSPYRRSWGNIVSSKSRLKSSMLRNRTSAGQEWCLAELTWMVMERAVVSEGLGREVGGVPRRLARRCWVLAPCV